MRFRALNAAALAVGCGVSLAVISAQRPAQPPVVRAQPGTQEAQTQDGRGTQPAAQGQQPSGAGQQGRGTQGQGAAPAPAPGGLPPKAATEEDLLNDKGGVPEGFTPIFNGKDLSGWHISKTNHHGTTPDYRVVHGIIVGNQQPIGQGGILLTDRKY